MEQMGLVGALKRTILEGVDITQFSKEYRELSEKDKEELVVDFNKCKPFGNDIEVVLKVTSVTL